MKFGKRKGKKEKKKIVKNCEERKNKNGRIDKRKKEAPIMAIAKRERKEVIPWIVGGHKGRFRDKKEYGPETGFGRDYPFFG